MALIEQVKRIKKTTLYIIIGIVIVAFVIAAAWIRHQAANQVTDINIPSGNYPTMPPSAPAYTTAIHSIGSSGISGRATFKDISGAVAVLLHIDGMDEDSLSPIELHFGTCAVPGALAYGLVTPDAEESETDLSIDLKQFNAQKPMAVLLYQSTHDHTAIACGDLP
jgi:hypothetical protein